MPVDAYASVREMPKFKKLDSEITAMRALSVFLPRDQRDDIKKLRKEFDQIVRVAEGFYEKLGDKHWVLHEDLMVNQIEDDVLSLSCDDLEMVLIQHYQDPRNLDTYVNHLKQHEALRARWDLIQRAKDDYLAGRFDVTAMVLIAVMDGFVNDVNEQERRGLHAREPEEMVGFDCLSGHHRGLTNVMSVFHKGFHKRVDDEVFELYRNGIMHGCITNFNNPTVATKAWNYLFAVSEWANNREEPEVEEGPSLKEVLEKLAKNQETRTRIEEWNSYAEAGGDGPFYSSPMKEQNEFLQRWLKGQVGLMLPYLMKSCDENKSSYIEIIKPFYFSIKFDSWTILRCEHTAPAVAQVDVILHDGDVDNEMTFRWLRYDDNGDPACEWDEGHWVLMPALQDCIRERARSL